MASLGTVLYRWFYGEFVGSDEFGNRYYRSKKKEGEHVGRRGVERRWVEYKGQPEPSKVPPYWHGWLHYITDAVPSDKDQRKGHKWEKPHLPNLTGTDNAYRPQGHILKGGKRAKATGDYQAWKP